MAAPYPSLRGRTHLQRTMPWRLRDAGRVPTAPVSLSPITTPAARDETDAPRQGRHRALKPGTHTTCSSTIAAATGHQRESGDTHVRTGAPTRPAGGPCAEPSTSLPDGKTTEATNSTQRAGRPSRKPLAYLLVLRRCLPTAGDQSRDRVRLYGLMADNEQRRILWCAQGIGSRSRIG